MIHDVAVAIQRLQYDQVIQRAMVVDTDVHQGNGTAAIFSADGDVFTLSIHQEHNYPYVKPHLRLTSILPTASGTRTIWRFWRSICIRRFMISGRRLFFTWPARIRIARTSWAGWR